MSEREDFGDDASIIDGKFLAAISTFSKSEVRRRLTRGVEMVFSWILDYGQASFCAFFWGGMALFCVEPVVGVDIHSFDI